jgi:hypothetical protein
MNDEHKGLNQLSFRNVHDHMYEMVGGRAVQRHGLCIISLLNNRNTFLIEILFNGKVANNEGGRDEEEIEKTK